MIEEVLYSACVGLLYEAEKLSFALLLTYFSASKGGIFDILELSCSLFSD